MGAGITQNQLAGGVHQASVTLTNAQILALPTTLAELIAAQGANKAIIPVTILFKSSITVDYTNIQAGVSLIIGDASVSQANSNFVDILLRPNATLATNQALLGLPGQNIAAVLGGAAHTVGSFAAAGNTALNLECDNGSDLTGGDAANTLLVIVEYRILNTSTGVFE